MDEKRAARLAELVKPFMVKPGRQVDLGKDFDPGFTGDLFEKERSDELLQSGVELLTDFQARLAAQDTYGLLVVLQAMDAAGKDGTIRHVMSGVNPQGVHVVSFKSPSAEELDHDYLWRCARNLPARGDITIFNRSYYEEVLVVRVHPNYLDAQKIPASCKEGDVWKRRYREINNWERFLVDNGFPIVKLFLNVSKEEQRQRFLDRLKEPDKNWKFSAGDAAERQYWDKYQEALSDMLSNTSTRWAPWYVIPADHKWFARVAAAAAIVDALAKIDPQFPVVDEKGRESLEQARLALEAEAPDSADKKDVELPAPAEAETGDPGEADAVADAETDDDAAAPRSDTGGPLSGDAVPPPGSSKGLQGRVIGFGEIELAGRRYQNDVVIDAGKIRKRDKRPSKAFRDEGGHTPLSLAEEIPWGEGRLIVGTGVDGALPIMAEVYEEADKRGVEMIIVPLVDAMRLLARTRRKDVYAVLHITC